MRVPFKIPQHWVYYLLSMLIALLSVVTVIGERGAVHLWRLRSEKAQLDSENYRLQKENDNLRQRVSRIRRDDYYLEKLAREELNMVRPGEVVYRFANREARGNQSRATESSPDESRQSGKEKTSNKNRQPRR
jgi:cell division protein FtsB